MKKVYKPSVWKREDALKIELDNPKTTSDFVPSDFPIMSNDLFIWDTMPLVDKHGKVVSVDGWKVIFTLAAPRHWENKDENGDYQIKEDWENRHGDARIYYWYSKTGSDWILGGRVMEEGVSPTSREWAGTPVMENSKGDVTLYYTCVTPGAFVAKVCGKIKTSDEGVKLSGFTKVKKLFEADGKLYQNEKQNPYWNFRDPCPFIDPKTGKKYILFEGNVAGVRGEQIITDREQGSVPKENDVLGTITYQAGCIGIAECVDRKGDKWRLLPPLVTALGVNDQTERPHIRFKEGKVYIFTISHRYTYAALLDVQPGKPGPDGVYGFVSDSLFGKYKPINGSGLVLGNPEGAPFQTYSHYVMDNGLVTSFIDSVPMDKEKTGMDYRIGGTLAPTSVISLEGENTCFRGTLSYGFIPGEVEVNLKK